MMPQELTAWGRGRCQPSDTVGGVSGGIVRSGASVVDGEAVLERKGIGGGERSVDMGTAECGGGGIAG